MYGAFYGGVASFDYLSGLLLGVIDYLTAVLP